MSPMEQTSLGIIGGADGPTAVFITGNPLPLLVLAILAVVVIALVVTKLMK